MTPGTECVSFADVGLMGVDPQKKSRGDTSLPPLSPFPSLPLEVGPFNPARVSGGAL